MIISFYLLITRWPLLTHLLSMTRSIPTHAFWKVFSSTGSTDLFQNLSSWFENSSVVACQILHAASLPARDNSCTSLGSFGTYAPLGGTACTKEPTHAPSCSWLTENWKLSMWFAKSLFCALFPSMVSVILHFFLNSHRHTIQSLHLLSWRGFPSTL